VLEVVEDLRGDTYRAVYTVKLAGVVYVLHFFQKKSTKGSETPKPDMDKIRERLKAVEAAATRIQIMMHIEQGSTNVYADLGHADAESNAGQGAACGQNCRDRQTPAPDPGGRFPK